MAGIGMAVPTDWWRGRLTADGDFSPVLLYGENLDVAFAPQHLNSDVLGVAREQEVHIPVADRQVREANPLDTVWKHGAPEGHAARGGVNLETQARGQEHVGGAQPPTTEARRRQGRVSAIRRDGGESRRSVPGADNRRLTD